VVAWFLQDGVAPFRKMLAALFFGHRFHAPRVGLHLLSASGLGGEVDPPNA
jgi:hypothetical protein